jgi:hypothetical protein
LVEQFKIEASSNVGESGARNKAQSWAAHAGA